MSLRRALRSHVKPNLCRAPTLAAALASMLWSGSLSAQEPGSEQWSVLLSTQVGVTPNVTYLAAEGWEGKLDVYRPTGRRGPVPTVLFFHGGGWVRGNKEGPVLHIFPYLQMGWAVVNVEYRVASTSLAPAAVEDGRCALRWVFQNAGTFGFDTTRIVTTGHSAGGHLALTTAMLPESAGLDRRCPGDQQLRVAAVVNWYGITDVNDLLEGPNREAFAVAWLGAQPEREATARRVSPLHYVREGVPPILSIHGDADPTVPYSHAVRLHQALDRVAVPNRLVTLPGVGHGGVAPDELLRVYATVRAFLAEHGITRAGAAGSGQ